SDDLAVVARGLLERMVRATQLRYPVVGDLARSIRFRWFDQPLVDAERMSVLGGVADEVAALAADPAAADRAERIEALTAILEQIVGFLGARLESGLPEQEPLLEVLVRRHYREHDLHDVRNVHIGGRPMVVAEYAIDDKGPTRVIATIGTLEELQRPGSALDEAVSAHV